MTSFCFIQLISPLPDEFHSFARSGHFQLTLVKWRVSSPNDDSQSEMMDI